MRRRAIGSFFSTARTNGRAVSLHDYKKASVEEETNCFPHTYGITLLWIYKTNTYLSSRIDTVRKNRGRKAAAKRGNTSNMFTYISEHHPSVQIQFMSHLYLKGKTLWFPWCGVNPRIQSWQWIFNAHNMHDLMAWWINKKTELSNHYMV